MTKTKVSSFIKVKENILFGLLVVKGAGGHHGLYFEAEVSKFVYNERAEELKHLTTQNLTKLYINDRGENTIETYRYIALHGACSYTAWKNEKELNAFLTKYKAIEEYRNKYHRVIWILNPIKT